MKQTEFNREDNALPLQYDPNTFQPVRKYRLTRKQTEFLIKIQKHITSLNRSITQDETYTDLTFISRVIQSQRYEECEISYLLEIRERYAFLYGITKSKEDVRKNPCSEIFSNPQRNYINP